MTETRAPTLQEDDKITKDHEIPTDWGIPENPKIYHVKGDIMISTRVDRHAEFLYTTEPLSEIHMVFTTNESGYPSVPTLMTDIPGVWTDIWLESMPAQNYGYCYRKDVDRALEILSTNGMDCHRRDIDGLDHANDHSSLVISNTQETSNGIMAGFVEMITQSIDVISVDYNIDIKGDYLPLTGDIIGDAYLMHDDDTYSHPWRVHVLCPYRLRNGKFSTLLYRDQVRRKLIQEPYPQGQYPEFEESVMWGPEPTAVN